MKEKISTLSHFKGFWCELMTATMTQCHVSVSLRRWWITSTSTLPTCTSNVSSKSATENWPGAGSVMLAAELLKMLCYFTTSCLTWWDQHFGFNPWKQTDCYWPVPTILTRTCPVVSGPWCPTVELHDADARRAAGVPKHRHDDSHSWNDAAGVSHKEVKCADETWKLKMK